MLSGYRLDWAEFKLYQATKHAIFLAAKGTLSFLWKFHVKYSLSHKFFDAVSTQCNLNVMLCLSIMEYIVFAKILLGLIVVFRAVPSARQR